MSWTIFSYNGHRGVAPRPMPAFFPLPNRVCKTTRARAAGGDETLEWVYLVGRSFIFGRRWDLKMKTFSPTKSERDCRHPCMYVCACDLSNHYSWMLWIDDLKRQHITWQEKQQRIRERGNANKKGSRGANERAEPSLLDCSSVFPTH